jgi:cytochrome c oxidase cbb3-type subunit III
MAEHDTLLEHEYDGIKEYDNPTPGWWHAIFLLTVVFSAFYALYWHGNPDAPTIHDKHAAAQLREIKRQFAELGTLEPDEQTILRMMNEPKWLAVGESVYKNNCASCHGSRGEGQVGPNLTDDFQKYGTSVVDIAHTIANGANQGAMPAWKSRLHPNEIILTAAHVASLRGKNLAGRAAEGEKLPPWPRPDAAPAK